MCLMEGDATISDILDLLRPPEKNWAKSRTKSVFGHLIGATAALVQCRTLIQDYIHHHGNPAQINRWREQTLFTALKEAINESGNLNWSHSPTFAGWAIGFFLNKAEGNVAIALDRCTHAWIGWRLRVNFDKPSGDDEGLFYPSVSTRLRVLVELESNQETKDVMNDLIWAFSTHKGAKGAKKCIKDLAGQLCYESLNKLLGNIPDTFPTPAGCTAVVCARVNQSALNTMHETERVGMDYLIEWVVVKRAIICVAQLWQSMLRATETLYADSE